MLLLLLPPPPLLQIAPDIQSNLGTLLLLLSIAVLIGERLWNAWRRSESKVEAAIEQKMEFKQRGSSITDLLEWKTTIEKKIQYLQTQVATNRARTETLLEVYNNYLPPYILKHMKDLDNVGGSSLRSDANNNPQQQKDDDDDEPGGS